MRARTEVLLAVGGLLLVQLTTTFGAIALFDRMNPAIAHIVDENSDPVEANASSTFLHDMRARDQQARDLGTGGAWAMAFLGGLSLMLAIGVFRRFDRRLLGPLKALDRATRAVARGDHFRRCQIEAAPLELSRIADSVNQVLDRQGSSGSPRADEVATRSEGEKPTRIDRAALLALLDSQPQAALLVENDGRVVAASSGAMARLEVDDQGYLRAALVAAAGGADVPEVERRLALKRDEGSVLWLRDDSPESGDAIESKSPVESEDDVQHEAGDSEVDGQPEHVAEGGDQGVAGDGGVEPEASDGQGQDGSEGRPEGDHA